VIDYRISYLRNVYFSKQRGYKTLDRSAITDFSNPSDFKAVCEDVQAKGTYPADPSCWERRKDETYGFTPCMFDPERTTDFGYVHRIGDASEDHLTLFIIDLDNKLADQPFIDFDQLQTELDDLGINYLIHTTASHTPEHPKVRGLLDISREITHEEGFKLYNVLDVALNGQLDGAVTDKGDFVYGLHPSSKVTCRWDRKPIDVDGWLSLYDGLPDDLKKERRVSEPVSIWVPPLNPALNVPYGKLTVENKRICNPSKLTDYDRLYIGGSHHQSLFGILKHIVVKTRNASIHLSFDDMVSLMTELDSRHGYYCQNHYEKGILRAEIRKIMQ